MIFDCLNSVKDKTAKAWCYSFVCTSCLYHRLESGSGIDNYDKCICDTECCINISKYSLMFYLCSALSSSLLAIPDPNVYVAVATPFSGIALASILGWEGWLSHKAYTNPKNSELRIRTRKKYNLNDQSDYMLKHFICCNSCIYYNIVVSNSGPAYKPIDQKYISLQL